MVPCSAAQPCSCFMVTSRPATLQGTALPSGAGASRTWRGGATCPRTESRAGQRQGRWRGPRSPRARGGPALHIGGGPRGEGKGGGPSKKAAGLLRSPPAFGKPSRLSPKPQRAFQKTRGPLRSPAAFLEGPPLLPSTLGPPPIAASWLRRRLAWSRAAPRVVAGAAGDARPRRGAA